VNDLTSIAALLDDWRAATRRPSVLIGTLLDEAAAYNMGGRIYTQILDLRARRTAERLESRDKPSSYAAHGGPLHGVPIAVKDNIDVAGTETSCGGRPERPPAACDAAIVRLLESLGAVVLGKTNLDEAALGATGRNDRFGRCINPRHERMLCGGSSSGSAASVAAGHTLLGVGTDTLGSVRIPAAFCGIAGFKPSHGCLSTAGVAPLYPQFDTVGLLGASLADIAHVFSALVHGGVPAHPVPAAGGVQRLACLDDAALEQVQPRAADDYRCCVDALRDVAEFQLTATPAIDFAAVARAAMWEVAREFAARSASAVPGYPAWSHLGSALRALLDRALLRPAARLAGGRCELRGAAARLDECLSATPAILTPTCPVAAPGIDEDLPNSVAAFVAPANVAGLPAVCWPQALPERRTLSLQLIGRRGGDGALLDLACRVQRVLDGL
jgi:aspartyl-tRNA(Asn)/glutamyl-tRNA(Gln) amidotransferase subunit A